MLVEVGQTRDGVDHVCLLVLRMLVMKGRNVVGRKQNDSSSVHVEVGQSHDGVNHVCLLCECVF